MSFYGSRALKLGRYGSFGDVGEAKDALNAAKAKVEAAKVKVANQKKLVAYTQLSLKKCVEGEGQIVGNILSGGVSAAICIADQNNQLGQRNGILVQFEAELESAKAEVKNAQAALAQAQDAAAAPPTGEPTVEVVSTSGNSPPGAVSMSRQTSGASTILGMSPLVIAAVAVPVVGVILYALTRKKASVAGYRRRR